MADTDTKDKAADEATDDAKATATAEVEKWRAMARKHEAQAKANADAAKRLEEIETASKSDLERAQAAANAAEGRAKEAEAKVLRYEVAAAKGVPAKLVRFLTGADEAEISASADELLEATGNAKPDTGTESTDEDKAATASSSRPKERLRGGADTSDAEPDETDPTKLAAMIPRSGQF